MRLRLQLLLSTVAICTVSGLVGWFFILNRLDKSIENLSKQQVAMLGQSLQSHSEIGEAFQNQNHEALNSLLKRTISSDAGLEYLLLTDAKSKILG